MIVQSTQQTSLFLAGPSSGLATTASTGGVEASPLVHPVAALPSPTHVSPAPAMSSMSICTQVPIVPDEDPQRDVAHTNDEEGDGYFGLMGDGIGEEDDILEDGDVDVDPGQEDTTGSHNSKNQKQARALPSWLMASFKTCLDESKNRGDDGLPPLYTTYKSFWFPQQAPFFLLLTERCTPQHLFCPAFFL